MANPIFSLGTSPPLLRVLSQLDGREIRHIVEGYSNKGIAKELSISVKTVETHGLIL